MSGHRLARALPLLLALSLAAARPTGATPFINEVIESDGSIGTCNSLAVDAHGNPHAAYGDLSNATLKYATKVGGRWTREIVPGSEGVLSPEVAVALDSQGRPHIVWWRSASDVVYSTRVGGVWVSEDVVTSGTTGSRLAIAVDSQGHPHIVYSENAATFKLMYVFHTGFSWSTPEAIDASLGTAGGYCGLALDAQDRPHVGYQGTIGGVVGVRYSVRNAGSWIAPETVDNTSGVGLTTTLALDAAGRPHLAYYSGAANNADLRYAFNPGTGWVVETADADGDVGLEGSIAVDAHGDVHASYLDATNWALRYARRSATTDTWADEIVDATGFVGCYTNIALDPEGMPHIIHYDNDNDDLRYATAAVRLVSPFGGELWAAGSVHEVVWQGAGVVDVELSTDGGFSYSRLASGVASHSIPVTLPTLDTEQARVRVVRADPFSSSASPSPFTIAPDLVSSWWHQAVDTTGQTGNYPSLALDSHDNPRIAFNSGPRGVVYAAWVGGQWTTDDVATGGSFPSLALERDGTPHIAYWSGSATRDLYYATRSTTSGWTTEAVETANDVGQYTSLALDSRGRPHIAYIDFTNRDLRYAFKGTGWTTRLIDGATTQIYLTPTAIAVDAEDLPHIVYTDITRKQVLHAYQTPSGWFTELVAVGSSKAPSVAIDSHGHLHASWNNTNGDTLFYGRRDDGSWSIEVADYDPDFATADVRSTSIALDGDDRPHISYMHFYELRHAHRLNGGWVIEEVSEPLEDPDVSTAYDGQHSSLAIDSRGRARIAYQRYTLNVNLDPFRIDWDLRYASSALELLAPAHAATWPVGARRTILWNGTGVVDVSLSTDGGRTYDLLAQGIRGGSYRLTVPSAVSTECKVKVERRIPHSVAVTDSFFEIESAVELQALMASPAEDGDGALLTWRTDPGPEDLAGYRIDRASDGASWSTLVSLTREQRYVDRASTPGARYRLYAVNGVGDELLLGEASFGLSTPLTAWPAPFRGGTMTVTFATYGGLGGGVGPARLGVFDIAGREVRVLADRPFMAGLNRVTWDGRDDQGRAVPQGLYFLRASSAGQHHALKIAVMP